MANTKSSKKRIRSNNTKKRHNNYMLKKCRTFIKDLKKINEKQEYLSLLNKAVSKLDKLAKKRIIHPNNAANRKSKLYAKFNKMAAA